MSATVGAALKKIAVALFTNPKVLKTVLGIVLGIVIALITPILAVIAVFNGGIKLDTEKLQQMITENLSAADQAMLQQVEDTMYAIENEMTAAGFTGRIKEAQVLYILALEDYAEEPDFVPKLVGCFTAEQTDEQLIAAVNAAFGTELTAEEFGEVMGDIRSTAVDTSDWTDKAVKNNLDLVRWAQDAADNGWGYVYGTYGTVLDEELLASKITQYPDEVGSEEAFIRQNWLGKRTADCIGLIKGYGWYDTENQQTVIDTESMPDITLNTADRHAVFVRQRVDQFREDEIAGTQSARQHKDATDLVCQPANGTAQSPKANQLIRRLTPLECERLQGFPDGWTLTETASDSARYKALGNSVAIPCVVYVLHGIALAAEKERQEEKGYAV